MAVTNALFSNGRVNGEDGVLPGITLREAVLVSLAYQCVLSAVLMSFLYFGKSGLTYDSIVSLFNAWDAGHYLSLAEFGYQTSGDPANFIVFFPLYPWLIRTLSFLGYLPAALVVSAISSIVGHAYFILILQEWGFDRQKLWRIVWLLFCSPIAVYFSLVYTEGLFLAETSLFLYFLQKRNLWAAVFMGFLASMTKMVGILFVIPYLMACIDFRPLTIRLKDIFKGILIGGGYGIYLAVNYVKFGDPFQYVKVQKEHWYKSIENPFTKYWSELQGMETWWPQVLNYAGGGENDNPTLLLDSPSLLILPILVLLYLVVPRRDGVAMPLSMSFWTLAQFLVFAAQAFWLSSARYIALILPVYVMIEELLGGAVVVYVVFLAGFFALSLGMVYLFSIGGWVL